MANVGIEPGGDHALACGATMGALLTLDKAGYMVEPVMDGGDYTNAMLLTSPTGLRFVVEVTPQESV